MADTRYKADDYDLVIDGVRVESQPLMEDEPSLLPECGPSSFVEPFVEFDVDGVLSHNGRIRYIGNARLQTNGLWRVLAEVDGSLCMVEATLTLDRDSLRTLAQGNGPDRELAIGLLKAGVV